MTDMMQEGYQWKEGELLFIHNQMMLERAFEIGLPFFYTHCTICCPVNISYQDELAFMLTFEIELMH